MDLSKAAASIRHIESKGNYSALGPVVKKGSYAGDRAYGAYQVMGKNIGPWSKEVLGRSVSKAEFLASSALQDKIFEAKFGQSARKYGNLADAASVWHSGRPLKKAAAAGATDGYMRTQDYVSTFSDLVDGRKPISARAAKGYASGVDEHDFATGTAATTSPPVTAMEMQAAGVYAGLNKLAELRQMAAQTARVGVGGPNFVAPAPSSTPSPKPSQY